MRRGRAAGHKRIFLLTLLAPTHCLLAGCHHAVVGCSRGVDASRHRPSAACSVGDVVLGLHGGKYQFGTPGAPSSDFADSLAASSAAAPEQREQRDHETAGLPGWATLTPRPDASLASLTLAPGGVAQEVVFSNAYRTWEPWFAAVSGPEGFELSAAEGHLAPRGGANNVCDPSKPYLDTASVAVRCASGTPAGTEAFLVVQTEEAQWTWRLVVASE